MYPTSAVPHFCRTGDMAADRKRFAYKPLKRAG